MKQSVHFKPASAADAFVTGDARLAKAAAFVRFEAVTKRYPGADGGELALDNLNLTFKAGGMIAIVGKSGSGKSTLLNLVTGVDHPTSGEIFIGETPVHRLDETASARWRRGSVGIVFQFFQLLPALTVLENVLLPMALLGRDPARLRESRARALLEQVGIADQACKLPTALSGGQQQRCAIARALANDPLLLVADEPTGNLDSRTADGVLTLLRQQADIGKTVLLVTHEREIGRVADRVVTLADGRVIADEPGARPHAKGEKIA
jgi:putative ABC transport system ATP-binding protein